MRGLFGRLGLSPQAAHFMVHDQSINSLTILKRLTDDSIKELCRVCRKPGGMIVHPNAGAPVAGGAAGAVYPAMYPNPGIAIAALHADNIKLASFYIRTCANVSRTCAFADVTLGSIETMRDYKIEIEAQVNLKISEAPKINANKVFEFFTEFGEFTLDMVGSVSKIPLSYVYRENEGPLPEALEPTFGTVGSTFACHLTMSWLRVHQSSFLEQRHTPITTRLIVLLFGRFCMRFAMVLRTIRTSKLISSHEMVVLPTLHYIQHC